ncbi:MAG TPA: hypothetical protein VFZ31_12255 [Vicinamibacterales bacterium]
MSATVAGCSSSCNEQSGPPQTAASAAGAAPADAQRAPTIAAVARIPAGPWTEIARRLVEAKNLDGAVDATREALARGGVATFDGTRALVTVSAPASLVRVTPLETVHMAMEARRRATASRLTAAELAQMLEGFGFPFPGARENGGIPAAEPRGAAAPAIADKIREAQIDERQSANAAERAERDRLQERADADEQAGRAKIDAAQQRIKELTDAWQKARQAVGKTPASERAAAESRVKEAWEARGAAIAELGRLRAAESDAEDERRTRGARASEVSNRAERAQRYIGPDFENGERLMQLLQAWVTNAAAAPNDPRSFTPLFLAEMALRQDPPIDLLGTQFSRLGRDPSIAVDLRGLPRSGRLRLTLLEIQLMSAAFLRIPDASASLQPSAWPSGIGRLLPAYVVSAQATPCSDLMQNAEKVGKMLGGDLGGAAYTGVVGAGTGAALDKAIQSAIGEAAAENFGKVMDALNLASKIARLVSFYSDTQVSVAADEPFVHKPLGVNKYVAFEATAGVSDEDLAEYQRALEKVSQQDRATRDCLEAAGMPKFTNLGDLAKEAEQWLVDWRIVEGSPQHSYFSMPPNVFYLPGRQAMKLIRKSDSSASAVFVVDILPEKEHHGKIVRAHVTVRASVDAAQAPSLGTLLNPITGVLGLVESLVELGAGWFQYMNQPKAYRTVEVDYHCPRPTEFYDDSKPIGDGGGGEGPNDCVIKAEQK